MHEWPSDVIKDMKKEGSIMVQKLQKKYPDYNIFIGVGNYINIEN
jgi:hypothetical protein